ncbi:P-loop containing nucleoside triphosphate hydrolase protein [Tricholoma matsutake]|nr:P-loop containing nucleoside triphosphate hydrolase protein [Tricholoma matsutake 945]
MNYYDIPTINQPTSSSNDWSGMSFTRIMGFSFVASLFSQSYLFDSAKLLLLGSLIETGRRLFQWLIERFRFQYSITAQFDEGDPAYEWIVLFLTQENVWRRSRDFRVNAKNSKRSWGVSMKTKPQHVDENADYVPTYEMPQLFRWNGYWLEIKRSKTTQIKSLHGGPHVAAIIYVTIYTLDMSVLSTLVEEARKRYIEVSKPHVTVYIADAPTYIGFVWNNVKRKARRPLSSIILLDGVIESLVKDAQEFIAAEDWYSDAGIPHRRGYLLYGPPGTGKTSTIYALAGELGLEIYALSLSSGFVDDSYLQKAVSSLPKHSILLIEDIDCAFPSRNDDDDDDEPSANMIPYKPDIDMGTLTPRNIHGPEVRKSAVTLSGLLNVLDGVGSEEGKLFFATTNYIDKLDSALLRPGRIDRKVQYNLATKEQASALYLRFFRETRKPPTGTDTDTDKHKPPTPADLLSLSTSFAAHVPTHMFSTAELQGYLLQHKHDPVVAVDNVAGWVEREMGERREKGERDEKRRKRVRGTGAGVSGGAGGGSSVGGSVGLPVGLGLPVGEGEGLRIPVQVEGIGMEIESQGEPVSPLPAYVDGGNIVGARSDGPSTLVSPL